MIYYRLMKRCNFADGSTLYRHAQSFIEVIENIHHYLKIVLTWFKYNQIIENPEKLKLLF